VTPTNASGGPADETAVLPPVREDGPGPAGSAGMSGSSRAADSETTAKLPKPPVPPSGAAAEDETAVLPPVPPGAADETAVLPPVRDDRVPPGYFRDERPAPDGAEGRTRELPQVDEQGTPRRRPRSDWAEETPLDDLPTLADELLGSHDEDDTDEGRGWRRRRR
jgi:dTMP kinase